MSENEIATWRSLGVEAGDAQAYKKAGLDGDDVEAWNAAGLAGRDEILAWTRSGWTPATAQPWLEQQFDLDTAVAWYKEKFTASQARNWVEGGFSLREAIDNRSKGLAPVK